MASLNRSERHFMRQRGAGSRDVNNVDFGFSFGPRELRDDRKLMRQRGAGNRQIDNVDFGFSFPTPSQSRRSSRALQTARRSVDRPSRTPGSSRKSPSAAGLNIASSLEPHQRGTSRQRSSQTPQPAIEVVQPNSGKRRRSKKEGGAFDVERVVVDIPPLSQSTVQKPERFAGEMNEPVIHNSNKSRFDPVLPLQDRNATNRLESRSFTTENYDKENEPIGVNKLNSSAKRRKTSLLAQPGLNDRDRDNSAVINLVIPSTENVLSKTTEQEVEGDDVTQAINGGVLQQFAEAQEPAPGNTANFTEPDVIRSGKLPSKKRKRKSIVLGARKRRSTDVVRGSSVLRVEDNVSTMKENDEVRRIDMSEDSGEVSEAGSVSSSTSEPGGSVRQQIPLLRRPLFDRTHRRRNRLSASISPPPREEEDEDGDGTYVDEEASPEPITPAPKHRRKGSRHSRAQKSDVSTEAERGSKPNRKSFPIVTHRIANVGALPTVVEEDEGDGTSEENSCPLPPAFFSRPHPNAVDVLAQICRETIQSAITKLGMGMTRSAGRSEIKDKQIALETFGENLDQQLFDISQAVDHRTTLEARLRKSRREKADLQARWIEVRRQRDETALKADTIRRQNWDNEEESKRQWELSELAHKTELELARDEADTEDLEFSLRHVASYVSSADGQGGILNRIKAFNNQLEQMALVLERR